MKTTMILILFLFLFLGCEKEQCKICTTTTTCTGGYSTKITFEACGKDLKDVDGKTFTTTVTAGGITVTCTERTNCK